MSEPKKPLLDPLGRPIHGGLKERIVERKNGCWNCTAFETGEVFKSRVKDCMRRDMRVFLQRGHSLDRATKTVNHTRNLLLGQRGHVGMCLRGATGDDFVTATHLCDQYSPVQGVKGDMRPGEGFDPLVEEVQRALDGKLQKAHAERARTDLGDPDPEPENAS